MSETEAARMLGGAVLTVIFWLLVNVVIGVFTGWLAEQKGYSGVAWFFVGTVFSVIALLAMAGAPVRTSTRSPRL